MTEGYLIIMGTTIMLAIVGHNPFIICLCFYISVSLENTDEQSVYPKLVWMFYNQNLTRGLDIVVNKTITVLQPEYKVMWLSPNNLSTYLNTDELPDHFDSLHPAHQADFIRIYLLHYYGGWWIDFSTLVNSLAFINEYYNRALMEQADFLAFGPPNDYDRQIVTNLLYAPRNSYVLRDWYQEVQKIWSCGCMEYIYSVLRSGVTPSSGVFTTYPTIQYYTVINVAYSYVIQRSIPRRCHIIRDSSLKAQYALWHDSGYSYSIFKRAFLQQLNTPTYPVIKLWGHHRKYIWPNSPYAPITEDDIFHPFSPGIQLNRRVRRLYQIWIAYPMFFALFATMHLFCGTNSNIE